MNRTDPMISIGELARRSGLAVSAIRHYEAEGLIRSIRSSGGHRQFRRADIRRVAFVQIARRFGFTLAEIRAELDLLPDGRTPNKADWTRISRHFRTALNARIVELERLRDRLDGCIGCGCLSMKSCQLYNAGDQVRDRGPGPRLVYGDT
jgi:MerR family redox-sensitive transcriptional activator SoxR